MHIKADNLCKQAREWRDQLTYHKLPANEVNSILNDITINANVAKATTIAYHSNTERFMKQKYEWTNRQINTIWWKPHHRSLTKLNSNDLIRIQKFTFNYLLTNMRKNMLQENHKDTCESCHDHIETENHILHCSSNKRYKLQELWLEELKTFLSKQNTLQPK
jgi:hypothetical protein